MKIISKNSRRDTDFWKYKPGMERETYLKALAIGLSEQGAREMSGFKGNVLHSRIKPPVEDESAKKSVIYSLANTVKLYADHKRESGIMGYKGKTAIDAGCFYAPYIPLMSSGIAAPQELVDSIYDTNLCKEIVLDPSPPVKLMTRYGEWPTSAMKSRTISANWTIDAMEDLKIYHGIDLEAELCAALTHEIEEEFRRDEMNDALRYAYLKGGTLMSDVWIKPVQSISYVTMPLVVTKEYVENASPNVQDPLDPQLPLFRKR